MLFGLSILIAFDLFQIKFLSNDRGRTYITKVEKNLLQIVFIFVAARYRSLFIETYY